MACTALNVPIRDRQKASPAQRRRSLLLLAVVSLAITGVAIAGAPAPAGFDQYTVSNGVITPKAISCTAPSGITITCVDGVSDQGMLQREVTISGYTGSFADLNGTYIQFILTDPTASGDGGAAPFSAARDTLNFTNEDWIKMHNRGAGVATKQWNIDGVKNGNIEDRFVSVSTYNFGPWAKELGVFDPWVDVHQEITRLDYSADPNNPTELFNSTADITENSTPSTYGENRRVALSQTVDLSDTSGNGVQGFKFVKAAGTLQTQAFTGTAGNTLLDDTWSWNSGEQVTAMWIGQSLDMGGSVVSKFGHTQYSADTLQCNSPFCPPTPQPVTLNAKHTSLTDPTAIDWGLLDTYIAGTFNIKQLFGLPPSLPTVPKTVSPTYSSTTFAQLQPTIAAGSAPVGTTTPVPLPIAYNQWTVSGGVFSPFPCTGSVTCGTPIVNEGGLFQRVVRVAGVEYIQTIVTDKNATGNPTTADFQTGALAFKNETFTRRVSSGGDGIASNLHIAEQDTAYQTTAPTNPLPSTGGQFAYNTRLKTGWANGGPTDPRVIVDQRVLVPDTAIQASSMDNIFHLEQGVAPEDQIMDMVSVVGTQSGTNGFGNPTTFATSRVSGVFQNTAHTTVSDGVLLTGANATNGGSIDWNQYDAVQVTWVGAEYPTPDPFNNPNQRITTTSYTNLSSIPAAVRTSSTSLTTSPPDPESWVNPSSVPYAGPFFSPAPTYTVSYDPASPLLSPP